MEIGGDDVIIEQAKRTDFFAAIQEVWPQATVEYDDDPYTLFVYRDEEAKRLWDTDVPVTDYDDANSMVHVCHELPKPGVTLVVGDRNHPEMRKIIEKFN